MFYCLKNDKERPEILATCTEVGEHEIMFARKNDTTWYTRNQAIKLGALKRSEKDDHLYPLGGIPVRVKIEDRALYAWWSGKWRPICYYAHNRKWNEKWVHDEVLRTFRYNVPLPEDVDINIIKEEVN